MFKKYISKSPEDTKEIGRELASTLRGGEVVCFYGDLGAGKTTLISSIVNFFLPEKRVLSPTFILMRQYTIERKDITDIFHVDLYRLESIKDIRQLGISDFMHTPHTVVLIEWAERLGTFLPENRIDIKIKQQDIQREIEIHPYGSHTTS